MTARRRSKRTDTDLVAAAQRGDAAAMEELLERHYDRVHAVCCRIAARDRDADDAAQEAMIRVVRNIDRFDGRSSFGTWVYRIATNTSLDELRKRKRRPQLHVVDAERGEPPEQADPTAHLQMENVSDRLAIEEALEDLPEDFKVPVVMRDVGDLGYSEIADSLGIPIGTVKSRIARGRRMLSEQIGNRDNISERPISDPRTHPPEEQ